MRFVLALSFLGALAVLVIGGTSYGRAVGLDRDKQCLRALYTAPPEGAEIFLIGSSRIRRGVEPDGITETLGLPRGAVVNLGHPTPSLPLDYAVIRELTGSGAAPQVVVFGVIPRSPELRAAERAIDPRRSAPRDLHLTAGPVKQRYILTSSYGDQIRRVQHSTDGVVLASWDTARLLANRMQNFIPAFLRGDVVKAVLPVPAGTYLPRDYDCMRQIWDTPGTETQQGSPQARAEREAYEAFFTPQDGRPAWQDPAPLGFLSAPEKAFERGVIHDMVALAEMRGFTPVFYYMPGIGIPVDPGLAAAFEDMFGAPLLIPPPELRAELADGMFYDNVHLNTEGRARLSPWLAGELAPYLDAPRL